MSKELALELGKDEEREEALLAQRGMIVQAQIEAARMMETQKSRMQEEDVRAAEEQMTKAPKDAVAFPGVSAGNLRGHALYRAVADMPDTKVLEDSADKKPYSRRA